VTDCIELASRLGKAMADSPEAVALRAARVALNAEAELTSTLSEYQKQADKIAQIERQQKPVEVEDKHKLQELNDKLVASEVFKKFTAAQVEYVDLMRKVNDAIRRELAETEE
jgi:cell fate (sporulation/competence/biofilm development) regulator YlbF (YheA/YmcA/DUF963 family)